MSEELEHKGDHNDQMCENATPTELLLSANDSRIPSESETFELLELVGLHKFLFHIIGSVGPMVMITICVVTLISCCMGIIVVTQKEGVTGEHVGDMLGLCTIALIGCSTLVLLLSLRRSGVVFAIAVVLCNLYSLGVEPLLGILQLVQMFFTRKWWAIHLGFYSFFAILMVVVTVRDYGESNSTLSRSWVVKTLVVGSIAMSPLLFAITLLYVKTMFVLVSCVRGTVDIIADRGEDVLKRRRPDYLGTFQRIIPECLAQSSLSHRRCLTSTYNMILRVRETFALASNITVSLLLIEGTMITVSMSSNSNPGPLRTILFFVAMIVTSSFCVISRQLLELRESFDYLDSVIYEKDRQYLLKQEKEKEKEILIEKAYGSTQGVSTIQKSPQNIVKYYALLTLRTLKDTVMDQDAKLHIVNMFTESLQMATITVAYTLLLALVPSWNEKLPSRDKNLGILDVTTTTHVWVALPNFLFFDLGMPVLFAICVHGMFGTLFNWDFAMRKVLRCVTVPVTIMIIITRIVLAASGAELGNTPYLYLPNYAWVVCQVYFTLRIIENNTRYVMASHLTGSILLAFLMIFLIGQVLIPNVLPQSFSYLVFFRVVIYPLLQSSGEYLLLRISLAVHGISSHNFYPVLYLFKLCFIFVGRFLMFQAQTISEVLMVAVGAMLGALATRATRHYRAKLISSMWGLSGIKLANEYQLHAVDLNVEMQIEVQSVTSLVSVITLCQAHWNDCVFSPTISSSVGLFNVGVMLIVELTANFLSTHICMEKSLMLSAEFKSRNQNRFFFQVLCSIFIVHFIRYSFSFDLSTRQFCSTYFSF